MQRRYVGIDLHRGRSVVVTMDRAGEVLSAVRIPNDPVAVSIAVAEEPAQGPGPRSWPERDPARPSRDVRSRGPGPAGPDQPGRPSWRHQID